MAYQSNTNSVSSQASTTNTHQMPLQNVQITQVVNPMLGLTNIISGTYQALTNNYRQNPQSLGNDPASILQNSINFSMAHMFSNLPQIMGFTNQIAGFFMLVYPIIYSQSPLKLSSKALSAPHQFSSHLPNRTKFSEPQFSKSNNKYRISVVLHVLFPKCI